MQTSAVKISDKSFKRMKRKSSSESAIKLHCSERFCFNADVRTTQSDNIPSVHTCLHK